MTTLTLGYRAINHKIKLISFPRINWKIVYLSGILLSLSMLISYVFLVNELTHGTYLIKNYEKEINILFQENRILETNSTKVGLLGQVMEKAKELGLEKTTNIKYVQIIESTLAKAK